MLKRLAVTDSDRRQNGDFAAFLLRPLSNFAATSATSMRLSFVQSWRGRSAVASSVGRGLNLTDFKLVMSFFFVTGAASAMNKKATQVLLSISLASFISCAPSIKSSPERTKVIVYIFKQ